MHESFMKRAIELAKNGLGRTSPNPAVGAVIVKGGKIIGEGYHRKAGMPHAEIDALNAAGKQAKGSTLYCTLEPCCHTGKTGPCTEAIIAAGITTVVIGAHDPNPLVQGKGVARLRVDGLQVEEYVLEEECKELIAPFAKHISTGLPFVILKAAMSLDGKIATRTGDSKWISSEESRGEAHLLRDTMDAIMVGIGTAVQDNPRLTCRIPGGRNPVRIVIDSKARLPPDARMLQEPGTTIVATTKESLAERRAALQAAGAEILICRTRRDGWVDLLDLMKTLGKKRICSVLLEGGSELNASMLQANLVDRFLLFIAPKIIGGNSKGPVGGVGVARMVDALTFSEMRIRQIGPDALLEVTL